MVKVTGKITFGDIVYILFILFCLMVIVGSAIGGWLWIYQGGFTKRQLILNLITTTTAILSIWFLFKHVFIFKINRHEKI